MSETRGEIEEKTSPVGKTEHGKESSYNVVSVISQLADDNLRFVRNISIGLAITGVIVIARSINLLTKFGAVSEIPARFIERNVSLRGRVHTITERGLEVEHVPIYLPVLSPLLSKRMPMSHASMCQTRALTLAHLNGADQIKIITYSCVYPSITCQCLL